MNFYFILLFNTFTSVTQATPRWRMYLWWMYLAFTPTPAESYRKRFGSFLLCLCDVCRALINSLRLLIEHQGTRLLQAHFGIFRLPLMHESKRYNLYPQNRHRSTVFKYSIVLLSSTLSQSEQRQCSAVYSGQ